MTIEEVRRFLLRKQGLLGDRRFAGKEGVLAYVRQAGCIQYDPVDVCGKNAELTLLARVGGFRKKTLRDLLYKDRSLIDYPDKELSIFPVEDWPYFEEYRKKSFLHGRQFDGLAELEDRTAEYIRKHGPVSADTLPVEGEIFWHSAVHWSGNWHKNSRAARSVLEQMYTDGRLVIHRKEGSRKFYDLAAKRLPESILTAPDPCPDRMEHIKWRILRRIGAVGMLPDRRSNAFLGIPMTTDERERAFSDLEREKRIIPVGVEGLKSPLYALADDQALIGEILKDGAAFRPRCEFLAPLDPFLWDRKLIEALFEFRYSWEIYTPADKRRYGYYVLPILWGERFVGRIEAAADRREHVLRVKNIWYEDGIRVTKRMQSAVEGAVGRLARFTECTPDTAEQRIHP